MYNFCWIPRENLAREMCCELVTWSVRDICCPKYVFLTGFGLLGVIVTYSYPKSNIYKTMEQNVCVQIDYSLDLCGVSFSFTMNHVYCNAVSQCVDESMEQDGTFFDFANLKIILTVFVFTSYNVFYA